MKSRRVLKGVIFIVCMYNLDINSNFGGRFPWKSRFIDHGGIRQAYIDEGNPNATLTFVCLHGNPSWSFLYREFIKHFLKKHRVIAVDHVGFGRSDKPHNEEYYTIEQHIKNLGHLLDETQAKNIIPIIHDWGGPIGMGWATRHPENIKGIVVLNTSVFTKAPIPKLPWLSRLLMDGWKNAIRFNLLVELFIGKSGTARKMRKEDLDPYRAPFPTPDDRIGMACMPNIYQSTIFSRNNYYSNEPYAGASATEAALTKLRQKPAIICWGLKDPGFGKKIIKLWQNVFSDLETYLFSNASHLVQEDIPNEVIKHIENWLNKKVTV